MQVNSHMDPHLVDKIVHEVKSQGVFDEFRKDSMADVDTKPAYQNLRQRVETTVNKFLSEQKWSPEMNKNQLRERLRKHITDSGFLDLGVERIVDQVVNPKIATVFQPKIEDIAYKYLGIPKPPQIDPFPILHPMPPFPVNGNSLKVVTSELLPNDLEQVSPDSDKATVKSECKDESIGMDLEEKPEDDEESPPFEPLVQEDHSVKTENATHDDYVAKVEPKEAADEELKGSIVTTNDVDDKADLDSETQDTSSVSLKTEPEPESDKTDQLPDRFQESQSQLSQVSSNSRLSVDTHENNNVSLEFNSKSHDNAVNISEEAQMPKFSENSNDDHMAKGENNDLHFDIKQDEIKFEGTKRKSDLPSTDFTSTAPDEKNKVKEENNETEMDIFEKKNDDVSSDHNFKFSKIKLESKDEPLTETSYSSSLEDSGTAQLCIVEKSDNTQLSQAECNAPIVQDNNTKDKDITLDVNSGGKNEEKVSDRIENSSNASPASSSRHKKHSKYKKSEKEKHREKDRDADKEKSRSHDKNRHRSKKSPSVSVSRHSSSSSKNHTSSSKYTSSCNKTPDLNNKDQSVSSSQHKSKHSSRSKSRDDSKKSSRDSDKKSSSSRDRSSQKNRKSSSQNDDHYASKDKFHWRKSTDSNDEDKKSESVRGKTNKNVSNETNTSSGESKNKQKNGSTTNISSSSASSNAAKCTDESKQNTSDHDTNVDNNDAENGRPKIVILNEILENPMTDFVELNIASKETQMHVVRNEDKTEENESSQIYNADELCFFEHNSDQFADRLKLIDSAMDSCRKVVNSLRFDNAQKTDADAIQMSVSSSSRTIETGSKREFDSETRATLHIDCIQYNKTNDLGNLEGEIESKRFKIATNASTLVSPSLSETSVNSKENEFLSDDITAETSDGRCKKPAAMTEKKTTTINKMSQQRYSSDDLYKPRPVLGQRSRRRGFLDTVV